MKVKNIIWEIEVPFSYNPVSKKDTLVSKIDSLYDLCPSVPYYYKHPKYKSYVLGLVIKNKDHDRQCDYVINFINWINEVYYIHTHPLKAQYIDSPSFKHIDPDLFEAYSPKVIKGSVRFLKSLGINIDENSNLEEVISTD
jgi:hypothetical protein